MVPCVFALIGASPVFWAGAARADEAVRPVADLGSAVAEMEALAARIDAAPAAARQRDAAATGELATNCPFNRATFMLVLTLDRQLPELDTRPLTPAERAQFDLVVRGVTAQARVAEGIGGAELPAPFPGDFLDGDFITGRRWFVDGAAFAVSADPIAETEAVLAQVPELVGAMPSATHARIGAAWRTLGADVDQQLWFGALTEWEESYRALAPALAHGSTPDLAARLLHLVDSHGGTGC